jgi:putative transposase
LQFAPSTYYAAKSRPPCARDVRDATMKIEIKRVYDASFDGCYGVKKVWKQLNHEKIRIANCTVRRLMRAQGLTGVRRGRQFKLTTITDENQHRPSDLVDRQFVAPAPNRLWVADLTYVKPTPAGPTSRSSSTSSRERSSVGSAPRHCAVT